MCLRRFSAVVEADTVRLSDVRASETFLFFTPESSTSRMLQFTISGSSVSKCVVCEDTAYGSVIEYSLGIIGPWLFAVELRCILEAVYLSTFVPISLFRCLDLGKRKMVYDGISGYIRIYIQNEHPLQGCAFLHVLYRLH